MNKQLMNVALLAGLFVVVGCGQKSAETVSTGKEIAKTGEQKEEGGHGWWCDEHGVVEEECSICQKEVFTNLKKDEVCPKHPDRASGQCFICNPDLWEKSKATYIAKYGKEPPEPKENMPVKK
ncbi:MAG: hypothetical protein R3B84_24815 [Zavarzinella sp.]